MRIVPLRDIPKPESLVNIPDLMKVYNVCSQMEQLCIELNGAGLSAVQCGIPWKVFIVREQDGKFKYYVNCTYQPAAKNKILSVEGCLSLKNLDGSLKYYQIERWPQIRLIGSILHAKNKPVLRPVDTELKGSKAIVVQHEIDHNLGILISDSGQLVSHKSFQILKQVFILEKYAK